MLPSLELKQRTQLIADAVHDVLPTECTHRYGVLDAMLHPDTMNHAGSPSDKDGICGWGLWPLTMVVGQHGLGDFEDSLNLLKEMTKRGTSEFDVRPFLGVDQARAPAIMIPWAHDENMHVRRLASEGTRPRLPWGMQLKQLVADPKPALPILITMRDDPEKYVRRSTANHLNDIAKDHPDFVAELAMEWIKNAPEPRQKLIRHACRTLIKQGHAKTLLAFGITPPKIKPPILTVTTLLVKLGETLDFSIFLHSTSSKMQKIIIDYVIHFRKANGSLSPKVFKWKQFSLHAEEQLNFTRTHAIRPITTRKYYKGGHMISMRINGKDWQPEKFELI